MDADTVIGELVSKLSEPYLHSIRLSKPTFAQIRAFITTRPHFEEHHAQQLVEAMCSGEHRPCSRLTSELFIVIVAVLRFCVPCHYKERGFSLLTDVLNDEDSGVTATQASTLTGSHGEDSQRTRKSRVGAHILESMLDHFLKQENDVYTRRQLGVLVLELIHECEPNQKLLYKTRATLGPRFYSLLQDEHDGALRIVAALLYRELQLSNFDLTDFCHPRGKATTMSTKFRQALGTASASKRQIKERLSWAIDFLVDVSSVNGNHDFVLKRRPPLLQEFSCKLDESNDLYATMDQGHSVVLATDRLTFMMYRDDDSIPFFVDVPFNAIEDCYPSKQTTKKGSRSLSCNELVIKLDTDRDRTLYIDGEGYKPQEIRLKDKSAKSQQTQSLIKARLRNLRWHSSSQAISPVNVSIAQRQKESPTSAFEKQKDTDGKAGAKPGATKQMHKTVRTSKSEEESNMEETSDAEVDHIETSPQGEDWRVPVPRPRLPKRNELPKLSLQPVSGSLTPRSRQQRAQQIQLAQVADIDAVSGEVAVFELAPFDNEGPPDISADKTKGKTKGKVTAKEKTKVSVPSPIPARAPERATFASSTRFSGLDHTADTPSRPSRAAKVKAIERIRAVPSTNGEESLGDEYGNESKPSAVVTHVSETKISPKQPIEQRSPMQPIRTMQMDDMNALLLPRSPQISMAPPPRPPARLALSGHSLPSTVLTTSKSSSSEGSKLSSRPTRPSSAKVTATVDKSSTRPQYTPRGKLAGRLLPQGTAEVHGQGTASSKLVEDRNLGNRPEPSGGSQALRPATFTNERKTSPFEVFKTPIGVEVSPPITVSSDEDSSSNESEAEDETQPLGYLSVADDWRDQRMAQVAQMTTKARIDTTIKHLDTPMTKSILNGKPLGSPPTDIRLARKPNLITFSSTGPRNQGVNEQVGWLLPAKGTRSRGQAAPKTGLEMSADTAESLTNNESPQFSRAPRIDAVLPCGDNKGQSKAQWVAEPRKQPVTAGPSTSNSALRQITSAGSPISHVVHLQDVKETDQPFEFDLTDETDGVVMDQVDEDVSGIVARGRRISEHPPKQHRRVAKPTGALDARPPVRGKKHLADSTPHEAILEGFLNLRNDHVLKLATVHNPFRGTDKVSKNLGMVTHAKVIAPTVAIAAKRVEPPTNQLGATAARGTIEAYNHSEAVMPSESIAASSTGSSVGSLPKAVKYAPALPHEGLEKTRLPQADFTTKSAGRRKLVDQNTPLTTIVPAKKTRTTVRAGSKKVVKPKPVATVQKVAKGPQTHKITKKRQPSKSIATGLVPVRSIAQSKPRQRVPANEQSSGRGKVPKALKEDEGTDLDKTLVERKKERRSRVRFPDQSDSSGSDSDASEWSDHSECSKDPDETLVDSGYDKLSPDQTLENAFLRFSKALMSPFVSAERQASSFTQVYSRKAAHWVAKVIEDKGALQADFQNRAAQSKKRVLSQVEASDTTVSNAIGAVKKRRILREGPELKELEMAGLAVNQAAQSCMSAFA